MKHTMSVLILAMLPIFATPAMAVAACGEGGTAKSASGAIVTRTAAEAKDLQIKADGYWWTCSTKPTKVTPPKNCYAPNQAFRTWSQGENSCTTAGKYASKSARDSTIPHGQIKYWQQWQGPMRGSLIEKCSDGIRTQVTALCSPATHCDVKYTFTNDGGKTTYVYDARGREQNVPIGSTVNAVSSTGKTMPIKCVAGSFQKAK